MRLKMTWRQWTSIPGKTELATAHSGGRLLCKPKPTSGCRAGKWMNEMMNPKACHNNMSAGRESLKTALVAVVSLPAQFGCFRLVGPCAARKSTNKEVYFYVSRERRFIRISVLLYSVLADLVHSPKRTRTCLYRKISLVSLVKRSNHT